MVILAVGGGLVNDDSIYKLEAYVVISDSQS